MELFRFLVTISLAVLFAPEISAFPYHHDPDSQVNVPNVPPLGDSRMDTDFFNFNAPSEAEGEISDKRYNYFKIQLVSLFAVERVKSLAFNTITDWMVGPPRSFTEEEIKGGIQRLEDDGIIIVENGKVYIIGIQ